MNQSLVDSKEKLEQSRTFAVKQMESALKLSKQSFNKLDRQGLKRAMYAIGAIYAAEEFLENEGLGKAHSESLKENEQMLIDRLYALQETVYGYAQIIDELDKLEKGDQNESTEQSMGEQPRESEEI